MRTEDLTELWGCHPREVYKRRWRLLGLCKTCRRGPLFSSGYCEEHYRKQQAGDLIRRRKRRWTVSREEVDRWMGIEPPDSLEVLAEQADRDDLWQRLLHDLLGSIGEVTQRRGRPNATARNMLFALALATRFNESPRAVRARLETARTMGWLDHMPHHNTMITYLREPGELLGRAEETLATLNAALALLNVASPRLAAPEGTTPLVIDAERSPLWMELVALLSGGRRRRRSDPPVPLTAPGAEDAPWTFSRCLGRLVCALALLVSHVYVMGLPDELPRLLGAREQVSA